MSISSTATLDCDKILLGGSVKYSPTPPSDLDLVWPLVSAPSDVQCSLHPRKVHRWASFISASQAFCNLGEVHYGIERGNLSLSGFSKSTSEESISAYTGELTLSCYGSSALQEESVAVWTQGPDVSCTCSSVLFNLRRVHLSMDRGFWLCPVFFTWPVSTVAVLLTLYRSVPFTAVGVAGGIGSIRLQVLVFRFHVGRDQVWDRSVYTQTCSTEWGVCSFNVIVYNVIINVKVWFFLPLWTGPSSLSDWLMVVGGVAARLDAALSVSSNSRSI